jgi:serine/threonine protein kinase
LNSRAHSLPENYKLHGFTIKNVLGQGGFGVTYLAHDNNLERDVAIKEYMPRDIATRASDMTIHPSDENTAENLQWGLEKFIKEARTLSKFDHPNIVRVHSVFEANNTAYMVMSYEQGKSFLDILKDGQPDEDELMDIILPLLDGLEVMHKKGFIHRDIKPANIFIRNDGTSVLLDFGSARQAMGEETKTLTKFVTPGYAPFEQYYGKSDMQGPWTDIYSLGATLYRAITGDPPIDSTFRNRSTGEKAILEIWDILDKHNSKYSTFFLRAIEHSLRSNFKDRPQSVSEWKVMFTDPSVSTQTQWRLASSSSGKSVFTEPIQLQGMRNRNLLIISVTVVLLLVALIIYLLIN